MTRGSVTSTRFCSPHVQGAEKYWCAIALPEMPVTMKRTADDVLTLSCNSIPQRRTPSAGGAYLLHLELVSPADLVVGALGIHVLPSGNYVYVGSARRGIDARVARHERLARTKTGKVHWHIDFILVHPQCRLTRIEIFPGADECSISKSIARRRAAVAPVAGFGSSDCRSGCAAHLYRFGPKFEQRRP